MPNGFEKAQFDALREWSGKKRTGSPAEVAARQLILDAYNATARWARSLQETLFPHGDVRTIRTPINQGRAFTKYTWSRVYPSKYFKKELAYTVGIDRDGCFIVKIDVDSNAPTATRSKYEAEFGYDFLESPIAALLDEDVGLGMSFDALVAWSRDCILKFEYRYDQVAARIGVNLPQISLLDDRAEVIRHMAAWRDALLDGSLAQHGVTWVPEGKCVLMTKTLSNGVFSTALGVDPTGSDWTVQINEPAAGASASPLSTVAIDANGRMLLIRQGLLKANKLSPEDVSSPQISKTLGVEPIEIDGRDWFVVADLDRSAADVRSMTGHFVEACFLARTEDGMEIGPWRPEAEWLAADETGGSYEVGARWLPGATVLKKHGIVYLKLKERLSQSGVDLRNARHKSGLAIDGRIKKMPTGGVLIEIKTDVTSHDLHKGVGQLAIYRSLFSSLVGYKQVLLLPKKPREDVLDAIAALGIHVFCYQPPVDEMANGLSFDQDFLDLCIH